MKTLILRLLLGASLTFALAPRAARAVSLSGTVHYGGNLGPVSTTRPIGILVFGVPNQGDPPLNSNRVARVTFPINDRTFDIPLPAAGTYYLVAFLDLSGTGSGGLGSPYQIYNHRFTPLLADPLTVPETGLSDLALAFDDTMLLSGIAGTVTYTGSLAGGPLPVLAFTDQNLTMQFFGTGNANFPGGPYRIITFDTGAYYLLAFMDQNQNGQLDPGEPFQIYNHKGALLGDLVTARPTQTDINFTFGDENLGPIPTPLRATATPTPTVTPISGICVGDCDGGGAVTVNEIITLVNMALGTQTDLSACVRGIPPSITDVSQIDVALIIRAVNNALNVCAV